MAFASFSEQDAGGDIAEINMVPLIDVMLVLLVIFIVAAPMLEHALKIDLPKAVAAADSVPPPAIQISIAADAQLYWNDKPIERGDLRAYLEAAARVPHAGLPELHLRAERSTPYESLAHVMSVATGAGLTRIAFVTDPGHP